MNEEIKLILGEKLIISNEEIPISHFKYEGKSKKFITWVTGEETPALSANDEDICSICPVDVDVFSDGNYLDIVKEIKKLMKNKDWIWTGDSPEMYEEDTGLYHKTISFEKERIL